MDDLEKRRLFRQIPETYPWFTIIQLFSPTEIRNLLNNDVIEKLRIPSLRAQYEFVQKRLQEISDDNLLGRDNSLGFNKISIEKAKPLPL